MAPAFKTKLSSDRKHLGSIQPRLGTEVWILAALFSLVGILPHIVFSIKMGELAFFKGAWDEDFYMNYAFLKNITPFRLLSSYVIRFFHLLTGGNTDLVVMLCDAILPFLCIVAAGYWAATKSSNRNIRILLILVMILACDILSFTNQIVWDQKFNWSTFLTRLPEKWQQIIPNTFTVYFGVFRTPEPQISWIIIFLFLGILNDSLNANARLSTGSTVLLLMLLNLLLPFSYPFCSMPILIFEIAVACFMAWRANWKLFRNWAVVSAEGVLWMLMIQSWLGETGVSYLSFNSRLPSITPTCLFSFLLILIEVRRNGLKIFRDIESFTGVLSLALVLMLFNQQLITGKMISTRDWDRNTAGLLLVFGALQLEWWNDLRRFFDKVPILAKILSSGFSVLLLWILVRGELANYKHFERPNVTSLRFSRLIRDIQSSQGTSGIRVALVDPYFDEPFVRVRTSGVSFVDGYTDTILNPVAPLSGDTIPEGWKYHLDPAFENLARTGVTPQEFQAGMMDAVRTKNCWPYLIAFFSRLDTWSFASDNRMVNPKGVLNLIPVLVENYRGYLQQKHSSWDEPTYLLTDKPPRKLPATVYWDNQLSGSIAGDAAGPWAFIYLQHQSGNPPGRVP